MWGLSFSAAARPSDGFDGLASARRAAGGAEHRTLHAGHNFVARKYSEGRMPPWSGREAVLENVERFLDRIGDAVVAKSIVGKDTMMGNPRVLRFGLALLLLAAPLMAACNTTAGFGQDISAAGDAVAGSASKVKGESK